MVNCQCQSKEAEVRKLEEELKRLKDETERLRRELKELRSDAGQAKTASTAHEREPPNDAKRRRARRVFAQLSDREVRIMTSLPCRATVEALAAAIKTRVEDGEIELRVKDVDIESQLIITLEKLRYDVAFKVQSISWGIEKSTLIEIFDNVVDVLHGLLWQTIIKPYGVPRASQNLKYFPEVFEGKKNCRLILDCLEIDIRKWKTRQKSVKFLTGISPSGLVCFVSPPFNARTKDDDMCNLSGLWNVFDPCDLVLAHESLKITNPPSNVSFETPKKTEWDSTESMWVHVERSVRRMMHFKFLHEMNYKFEDRARVFVEVCAALVNLRLPVWGEVSPLLGGSIPEDEDSEPEDEGDSGDDYPSDCVLC
jgi:hypothetical protein